MNTPHPSRDQSAHVATDTVSYTTSSLAAHMDQCARARSRWFGLHAVAERAHALVTPRLVTFGALVAIGCLALISFA